MIGKIRNMDNKLYKYQDVFWSRREADESAKRLRKTFRKSVRVVKDGNLYGVWIAK